MHEKGWVNENHIECDGKKGRHPIVAIAVAAVLLIETEYNNTEPMFDLLILTNPKASALFTYSSDP